MKECIIEKLVSLEELQEINQLVSSKILYRKLKEEKDLSKLNAAQDRIEAYIKFAKEGFEYVLIYNDEYLVPFKTEQEANSFAKLKAFW